MTAPARRDALAAAAVIAGVGVAMLWTASALELAPDEAYYWVWSRDLAWGYFDHPPAIAAIVRAGTALLGDTELGVRAGAIAVGAAGLALAAASAPRRALAALALGTMPLLACGGVVATPDTPLLAAWALGLWAALRGRWALVGLAAGLAMMSKYTGLLLLPLLVAARPAALRGRGPWLAAALALAVYAPNALWNLAHDTVSWRFQLAHAAGGGHRAGFLAAQVALAGPALFAVLAAWWAVGWRGSAAERLCWWASFPVLVVGVLSGGEANWAAPAYVGAVVGAAHRGGRWPRVLGAAAGVGAALSLLVHVHAHRPLVDLPNDPLHRLVGGRALGESVAAWGVDSVWTERYQEAALIHFYGGVPARAWPGLGRPDQYDLLPFEPPERGLYVRPFAGIAPLPIERLGYDHGGQNVVSAYADTPDPRAWRLVARWQVYEFWRTGGAAP